MAEKEKEKEKEKAKENGEVTTVTESPAGELEELPKTIVRRLVKDKLSQLSAESEITVFREALQAFSESGRIFIHYLTAAANDICKESNRQIINAEDVFKALEEIDFPEFVQSLRAFLEEFRQRNASQTFFFGSDIFFWLSFGFPEIFHWAYSPFLLLTLNKACIHCYKPQIYFNVGVEQLFFFFFFFIAFFIIFEFASTFSPPGLVRRPLLILSLSRTCCSSLIQVFSLG